MQEPDAPVIVNTGNLTKQKKFIEFIKYIEIKLINYIKTRMWYKQRPLLKNRLPSTGECNKDEQDNLNCNIKSI